MANRKQKSDNYDPTKQFSKKLAGRTEWFWFFYMVLVSVLLGYQPSIGMVAVCLAGLVTIVMITSVLAYTNNSKYDKALYTIRTLHGEDKTRTNSEEEQKENG